MNTSRLLALSILLAALPACARPVYRSDFLPLPPGPAKLPDWDLLDARYELQDGWLTIKSERSNPRALLKRTLDGDFTFRGTVRGATESHWSGLLARGVYRLEVNNQFVELALLRLVGDKWEKVARAPSYSRYLANTGSFELRLVRRGNHLSGFLDSRKLVEYDDPNPAPAGGQYGLLGGWGTNVAWRSISLDDEPDEREWPREKLAEPLGRKLVEVTRVRGLSDQEPFDNLYYDGQPGGFRLKLKSADGAARRVSLRFRLVDVWQQELQAKRETVELPAGEERELTVSFDPARRGCFKVALDAGLTDADVQWVEDVGSFTVVSPELYNRPRLPNSYFGGHMDGINLRWHLQVGRKLGVQWARCHDMMQWTWWDRVQPERADQWIWGDEAQKTVDDLGFQTSGEFLWVPKWAQQPAPAGVNPATYPPARLEDFARYVYETVSHYKGSIHHWEVWNEPHYSGFFSGTPEQYAELMQVAYREVKRADPQAVVIGGGGSHLGSLGWIDRMLTAAGGKSMDVFTIHYLDPDQAPEKLAALREMLQKVGFSGPIWNSEEAVESSSFLDQLRTDSAEPEARYHFRNACAELVRTYLGNLTGGVQRVFQYTLADPWRMKAYDKPRVKEGSGIQGWMWEDGQMLKPLVYSSALLTEG